MAKMTPHKIIESDLEYIITTKKELSKKDEGVRANILRRFGMMSQSIAKQYLLLDNVDEAKKWFTESANYYLQSKVIKDTLVDSNFDYSSGLDLLVSASLSGDEKLKRKVIESILKKNPHSNPPGLFLKFQIIVSNLTFGNDDVNDKMQELKSLEEKYGKNTGGYYLGYADSLKAIQTKNTEELLKNVEKILPGFSKSSLHRNYPYELTTAMLLMLGKKRGMEIDLEKDLDIKFHKYLPMNLLRDLLKI